MNRNAALATLAMGVLGLIGWAIADTDPPKKAPVVDMTTDMKYEPAEITITAGDAVRWKNVSIMPHTVTADPALARKAGHASLPAGAEPFNSGMIGPGKSFEHTFTVAGTYKYFCIPHETMGMVGKVIVKPAATSAPAP